LSGCPPIKGSINRLAGTHGYIGTIDVDTDWQIQARAARFGQYVGPILQDFGRYWGMRAGELQSAYDFSPVYRHRCDCTEALVPAIRRDIQDLVAAAATTSRSRSRCPPRTQPRTVPRKTWSLSSTRSSTSSAVCTFVVHICFGSFRRLPYAKRTYRWLSPALLDANVHGFSLEFGDREMAEIDLVGKWTGSGFSPPG